MNVAITKHSNPHPGEEKDEDIISDKQGTLGSRDAGAGHRVKQIFLEILCPDPFASLTSNKIWMCFCTRGCIL